MHVFWKELLLIFALTFSGSSWADTVVQCPPFNQVKNFHPNFNVKLDFDARWTTSKTWKSSKPVPLLEWDNYNDWARMAFVYYSNYLFVACFADNSAQSDNSPGVFAEFRGVKNCKIDGNRLPIPTENLNLAPATITCD